MTTPENALTRDPLIEQLAARIAFPSRPDADKHWSELSESVIKNHYRETAKLSVRFVRAWDVEQGPSEAEIDRADWAYLDARKNGYVMTADCMERGLSAAAAERAWVAEQEPRP